MGQGGRHTGPRGPEHRGRASLEPTGLVLREKQRTGASSDLLGSNCVSCVGQRGWLRELFGLRPWACTSIFLAFMYPC